MANPAAKRDQCQEKKNMGSVVKWVSGFVQVMNDPPSIALTTAKKTVSVRLRDKPAGCSILKRIFNIMFNNNDRTCSNAEKMLKKKIFVSIWQLPSMKSHFLLQILTAIRSVLKAFAVH